MCLLLTECIDTTTASINKANNRKPKNIVINLLRWTAHTRKKNKDAVDETATMKKAPIIYERLLQSGKDTPKLIYEKKRKHKLD